MMPIVAIVGRPNVGKSTLFNRLIGRHAAIVEDEPGVTRDRHYAEVEWGGRHFLAVDTGGFWVDTEEPLLREVRKQAEHAIKQSQAVILVVDARAGVTPADQELAVEARKSGKPILVALNKLDTQKTDDEAGRADFYRLGLQELYAVSAEHGRGIGPLLDDLVAKLPGNEGQPLEEGDDRPRVAILGRPNVGKSTFANRLLGESWFVESAIAGTTRDAIDAEVISHGRPYVLTDTAGIRRKGQTAEKLEFASVARSFDALERSSVAIVLLDATEPAVEQDSRLVGLCADKIKPSDPGRQQGRPRQGQGGSEGRRGGNRGTPAVHARGHAGPVRVSTPRHGHGGRVAPGWQVVRSGGSARGDSGDKPVSA